MRTEPIRVSKGTETFSAYALADMPTNEEVQALGFMDKLRTKKESLQLMAYRTGEFRAPKAGEWFLSGAIPRAYRTNNTLSGEYHILKLCVVRANVVYELQSAQK